MKSTVLIVEDSPEVRSGLKIALEGAGYTVVSADDGREGIRLFREKQPDVALLDIRMPRLSGIDVCTLIRNESDVPVIMFSGIDEDDDVRLALARGATDYVLKDTGFRVLLERVEKHLRRRAADLLTTQPLMRAQSAGRRARVVPFVPQHKTSRPGKQRSVAPATGQSRVANPDELELQTTRLEAALASGPLPPPASRSLENLAIVAHSDPALLAQLAQVTARTGFEIVEASTGQQAIESLALRRPKLLVVGSVLTDMNCLQVFQACANHPVGELIATVLTLGRRSPELVRRALYLGVHEAVYRPWDDGRLDVAIRSALARTRPSRSRVEAA